jgi:hypothetical protein
LLRRRFSTSLRLITSPACRGEKRVPLSLGANPTGLSRQTLYRARDGGQVTAETVKVLTPLIRQHDAGKLRFKRTGPRRRGPNHWEIIER